MSKKDEMSVNEAEQEIVKESEKLDKPKASDSQPGFKGYAGRKNVRYKIVGPVKKPKSFVEKDGVAGDFEIGRTVTLPEDPELEALGRIKRVGG